MTKTVCCTKCKMKFKVAGDTDRSKEVPQGVTCPYCREPNDVMWPMNCGWKIIAPPLPPKLDEPHF